MTDEPTHEPLPEAPPGGGAEVEAAPLGPDAAASGSPTRASPDPRSNALRGPRPDLVELREPLYREAGGYRLRLDPPDLARLRELPGGKGKTDQELGEQFFNDQAARFAASLVEDLPPPAEIRVVVDPYSRQAFLAQEKTIRAILSF